jgi:signal transduction histidine kinase/DNA-binding response OmpR family regulator/ligand-binding sensor domain-containing protein
MKTKKLFWLKMKDRLTILLFLIACLMPCIAVCQSYPYKFNYLTVDEGLSHTDANDIAQDKYGYIWVATFFGLNRYDGYSIKKYYNENLPLSNAKKNRLVCVYPDANGDVWLGSEDGLQCFNTKKQQYIDYTDLKNGNPGFRRIYKPAGKFIYGLTGSAIRLYLIKGNVIEEQKLNAPADIHFSDMAADKNGQIYLTSNEGLWLLDKNNRFKNIAIADLPDNNLTQLHLDKNNNLLISAGNTVFLTGKSANSEALSVIKEFDCKAYIKNIASSNKSDYWVNAGSKLVRLDAGLNLVQTINNQSSLHSLNSNSLNRIFIDRSECLWVCTFGGGVNYCDLNQKLFYTLQHNPEVANSLSGNHIRSVMEDGTDLWIGTTANGLNRYDLNAQKFTFYNTGTSAVKLKRDEIIALTLDAEHNLWIGTGAGIDILKPNRSELLKPAGYEQFPGYGIETLVKDYYGNIWFGNHTDRFGVIWKDKQNYYHVKYYDEGYFIYADKNRPQLFVSSTHGLKRAIIDAEGNISNTFSYKASAKPNSLSSDYTYPVARQNDSTYWVGTIGGGLNSLVLNVTDNSYAIKWYGGRYGVFNDVESLEIDDAGNIWMGGNGLEQLDPAKGKLIRYDKNDGLQGNSFKVGSSYKGASGRLYFGGISGLNYFYPAQIKANTIGARPILTDILINNQKPQYTNADASLSYINHAISYGKELTINYLQNNFVIYFSAMHFANPLKCKYRYKLIGFDKDWNYTDGKNPSAAYSNLDYNSYKFIVEATNNEGVWSGNRAETSIVITPPWWKSGIAKTIYALLAISALAGIYIYQARWYRLKREMELNALNERKREEMHKQREEVYQQQLMFFTNISHEFRTPLTLILGPLENLMSQNKNSVLDSSYQLMSRNAKRLINLISELMNFKKVADSVIKLQVQPLAIDPFCDDLAQEFKNLAVGKDIDFKIYDKTGTDKLTQLTGWFDAQVLEKILFNLLSNSFKYTNAGGEISFELFFDINSFKPAFVTGFQLLNENTRADKYIYFRVADSGIGISSDSISKIFDRYYRVSNNHLGSGVGLALVKSLTQLHKGDIYVYSERNRGTEIIIGIPYGEENYNSQEKAIAKTEPQAQLDAIDTSVLLPLPNAEQDVQTDITKNRKYILLVDDNQELRVFLKQTFEIHYNILEAEDGQAAIEIATEKIPDLIISDIMMPGINGIELCKIIKDKFETSHIPFIILSAKDALDTKIAGMESGADYYFAKPLSIDLLLLTVNNIFEQDEKLKQRYANNYLSEATELVHSEKDKEFFQKLLSVIENNIQDQDLDVDFLCRHLYISRTKLYQKIKSVSQQSVGEFIRTVRLKRAIHIMTHEDIPMNEVVDRIGLQSSSNFSRAFKKEYGKSPLQFMQSLRRNQPV